MTNTLTTDVDATIEQINQCAGAGADLVRVSVPDEASAEAFGLIKKGTDVPLIADIHFDYKLAIASIEQGADCIRFNPGNIGGKDRVRQLVSVAQHHNVPIRIGVNAGSLEKDIQKKYGEPDHHALVESALRHAEVLESLHFTAYKISVKASDVNMAVAAYTLLSQSTDNPIHLGITEAGGDRSGIVRSSIGIGLLLSKGIGDTLRVSLSADPSLEVKVGWDILKSLKMRSRGVHFIACPGCARQNFDVAKVVNTLESRLEDISESIDVCIIGCIVNGPGESKRVTIGLTGGSPNHLLYVDGKVHGKVHQETDLIDTLETVIRNKVTQRISEKS